MCSEHEARHALEGFGLIEGLAAEDVQARLIRCLRLEEVGQRGLAFYLHEVEVRDLHLDYNHGSTVEFAKAYLDLSPRRTRELIAAEEKLRQLPAIDKAFADQRITWTKVLLLLRVAGPDHAQAWVEKAEALSCKDLRGEILRARPGGAPCDPRNTKGTPEIRYRESLTLGVIAHQKQLLAMQKMAAELDRPVKASELQELLLDLYLQLESGGEIPGWKHVPSSLYRIILRPVVLDDQDDTPLFAETPDGVLPIDGSNVDDVIARQRSACACCDGEVMSADGDPVDSAPIDGTTSAAMRLRVLKRDGGICRCCGTRGDLHVHHIVFRSRGGRTKVWNLLSLCMRCHALVHEGLLHIEGKTQKKARFVDEEGRSIHHPGRPVDPAVLLRIAEPKRPSLTAAQEVEYTTLDSLPAVVDSAWWTRHADLIRCRGAKGLELRAGRPALAAPAREEERGEADAVPLDAPLAVPFAEAFEGIVGQAELIERFRIEVEGGRALGGTFPHTLFLGPPGTGKTTLARAIAASVGSRLIQGMGPLLQDTHALIGLLTSLGEGDMLFLDEIHAMPQGVLEVLYGAMAEGRLTLTLRAGPRSRTVRLDLPRFTLLAATTEPAELPRPLRSRFALREHLDFYKDADLACLIASIVAGRGFEITEEAARMLAASARGTPREAKRLVERVLRSVASRGEKHVDGARVREALRRLGYDEDGLVPLEQRYLDVLRGGQGPMAGARIASALGLDLKTLLHDVEPWLCRLGFLLITPRGREAVKRLKILGKNALAATCLAQPAAVDRRFGA